jgi:hypothetical protein
MGSAGPELTSIHSKSFWVDVLFRSTSVIPMGSARRLGLWARLQRDRCLPVQVGSVDYAGFK